MTRAALPDWPALMSTETACAYLDLGVVSFQALTAEYKVGPLDMGRRIKRWRRADLDAMIERMPLRSAPDGSPAADFVPPDLFEAGLQRASRARA